MDLEELLLPKGFWDSAGSQPWWAPCWGLSIVPCGSDGAMNSFLSSLLEKEA